mmetsp:Transcript_26773/g.38393  ORF Transcript_26773/g.38393 Transcript_26773/m.38393 type:complete len:440 (-) Transcript_26773:1365-2684(-)
MGLCGNRSSKGLALASDDAILSNRGGGFAAIAAIMLALQASLFISSYFVPWSSTLLRWNDNAAPTALNTTRVWGNMGDFFHSGAIGAMLLMGLFIFVLPTIGWLVLQPMLISHYYSSRGEISRRGGCGSACVQQTLEILWKIIAFGVFLEIITYAANRASVGWNNANVDLMTVAQVGLGLFTAALLLGMLYAALMRRHMSETMRLHEQDDNFAIMEEEAERSCGCCKSPIACFFGFLAVVLLLPALLLPVVRFTSSGALSNLVQDPEQSYTVPKLATSIGDGSPNRFFGGLASAFVWLTVIILPILALLLSLHLRLCRSWRDGSVQYSKPFRLLQFIFPFVCAIAFAFALLVAIASIGKLSSYFYQKNDACGYFDGANDGGECYSVNGAQRPATWLFLIWSVATEIYAFLTLKNIRNLSPGSGIVNNLTSPRSKRGVFS